MTRDRNPRSRREREGERRLPGPRPVTHMLRPGDPIEVDCDPLGVRRMTKRPPTQPAQ